MTKNRRGDCAQMGIAAHYGQDMRKRAKTCAADRRGASPARSGTRRMRRDGIVLGFGLGGCARGYALHETGARQAVLVRPMVMRCAKRARAASGFFSPWLCDARNGRTPLPVFQPMVLRCAKRAHAASGFSAHGFAMRETGARRFRFFSPWFCAVRAGRTPRPCAFAAVDRLRRQRRNVGKW